MNALIFAAGLGTRLKPLTDTMPKAMVPIHGKPLVQILIEKLKTIGVDHIVINVHHFAQQIIDFVEASNHFGIDIQFSDETDMLLETGGGLKKAACLFPNADPILVHNVDILSNADLLLILSDIDSLYDDDPRTNPNAKPIPVVEKITPEIEAMAGGAGSKLGTGGMSTKITAAKIATNAGIDMIIMNGKDPEKLYDLFEDKEIGTLFKAQ